MSFILRADGGSRGNPGPAASGAVLYEVVNEEEQEIATAQKYLGEATNNTAEYTSIIIGLDLALEKGISELVVQLDSELAVKQLTGVYKIKKAHLQELAYEVKKRAAQFSKISFGHIRRELNTRADELVNICLDNQGC